MNLDEFNSLFGTAFTDSEKALVLTGLFVGCNGGTLPEHCSQTVHNAFTIGACWRAEADGFREKKADAGKKSAQARQAKLGSSNPRDNANREHSLNTVHTQSEQTVNQSTIHNPLTTKEEKKPSRMKKVKPEQPPIPDELFPFLEHLTTNWPRKNHDKKRVTILRPIDSWDKICKNRESDEPRVCINAGLAYLESSPTEYIIGMDNFFGEKRKYTRYVVEE